MSKKTILVVDDTIENLHILQELLGEYDIITVTNGKDALEITEQEKIDLILLDIMMPDMDGYTVCKKLKSNITTKDIPIIFITTRTDQESIEKAYEVGGADYITKPFFPKELQSRVKLQLISSQDVINLQEIIPRSKNLKILFVEDNIDDMEKFLQLLEKFFTHIDVAHSGKEGLQLYKKQSDNYDLVISNLIMPDLSGLELSKNILKINKDQDIFIISQNADSKTLEEMIDIGISNFLYKPVQFSSFIQILDKTVKKIEQKKYEYNKLNEIQKLNHELDALVDSFDRYVIASRTDLKGKITYASKAYESISGYKEKELIGKPHNIVRHPDMPKIAFQDMWETISNEMLWVGEVKNLRKDGSYYWVKATVAPYYDKSKKHIGYSAIRLDISAQKEVEKLHTEVNNLLNNVAQGFLSFDKNLLIQQSYSKECLTLFNTDDITNKKISELLFNNDKVKKELFEEGIFRALETEDPMIKELFLSLLPVEHKINNKDITLEYKVLEDEKFMLIATDITKQKEMQQYIEKQNKIQRMIVSVASNKNDFIELKNEFELFLENTPNDLEVLTRELHTFKGIFSQKEMLYTPDAIHNLETIIDNEKDKNSDNIKAIIHSSNLKDSFHEDLKLISLILSKEFLESKKTISIDIKTINDLESRIGLLRGEKSDNEIDSIVHDIKKLKYESLYTMLNEYIPAVKQTAQKLQKEIYPLTIKGDKALLISPCYRPFLKSLIHLFNNCVDHGIEDIETRVENNKDEIGTITCEYSVENGILQIKISDDGGGIDVEKLSTKAIESEIVTQDELNTMDSQSKLMLLFQEKLSTKENASITSGRGIGMGVIKSELEKIEGKINIENNIGDGVSFIFTFQLSDKGTKC